MTDSSPETAQRRPARAETGEKEPLVPRAEEELPASEETLSDRCFDFTNALLERPALIGTPILVFVVCAWFFLTFVQDHLNIRAIELQATPEFANDKVRRASSSLLHLTLFTSSLGRSL